MWAEGQCACRRAHEDVRTLSVPSRLARKATVRSNASVSAPMLATALFFSASRSFTRPLSSPYLTAKSARKQANFARIFAQFITRPEASNEKRPAYSGPDPHDVQHEVG